MCGTERQRQPPSHYVPKLFFASSGNSLEMQNIDFETFSIDLVKQENKKLGEHIFLQKTLKNLSVAD